MPSEKFSESLIPSSGSLFQPIESVLNFVDMIWKAWINEPYWMLDENFLIWVSIRKEFLTSIW